MNSVNFLKCSAGSRRGIRLAKNDYGDFEGTIPKGQYGERMILDLDRQPLVMGVERRPLGHSPGFENAIQLEPQIIVQAGGIVLLDHEPATGCGLDSVLAAWLPSLPEVALRSVGGQLIVRHLASSQRSSDKECH